MSPSEGMSIWRSAPVPHPDGTALTPSSKVATQGTELGTRCRTGWKRGLQACLQEAGRSGPQGSQQA